jgi:uncharacterized iron-regulated membrane protein
MNKLVVNKLHRYVGIACAPFLVLQTLSGLFLDFGLFRRSGESMGGMESRGAWDAFLVKVHFGPGWLGDAYHLLLGAGIVWMAVSGWVLYLRVRRAQRGKG